MRNKENTILIVNSRKNTFAYGIGFYKLFWIFMIGCFLGVVLETITHFVFTRSYECRWGLIYGPFNPVYGIGAVIMTVCLNKLSNLRDLWIFLICMVIGSVVEFLCSYFQEMIFHTVSWDYSADRINFGGRTSMLFGFFWGILGLIWIKDLYPVFSRLIEKIPKKVGVISTWIVCIYMIFNITISAAAVYRQTQRSEGIEARNSIEVFLDKTYPDDFLKTMYPNMSKVK